MRVWILIFLLFATAARAQTSLPPGGLPVEVETSFYLFTLRSVDEKEETFDADIYMQFSWMDQRLAHPGEDRLTFVEEAASDKLKEIWWPQIEFINASSPEVTNLSLEIQPDGKVLLNYALSSTFRSELDLKRFPFDTQTLSVQVASFLYAPPDLVFKANPGQTGLQNSGHYEGFKVLGVDAESLLQQASGWLKEYSEYRANIRVQRVSVFYIWTVFVPVILIFVICCTIYLLPSEELADRVGICLTTLLACIATQFTLSFDLPQISYLTLVDRLFIVTYAFTALNVLVAAIEVFKGTPRIRNRLLFLAGVPLAYLVALLAVILI